MERAGLRVRLLGGMDLRIGDDPLPPLGSARAESLLACLLLHRHAPLSRQQLAFLLWPESEEAQARTNLRKVLLILRRELPGADRLIDVGPRTLRWRDDTPLWLDTEEFERAVADGRLEEAVDLYGGDLLEGSYDEWPTRKRTRLASLYLEALEQLAHRYERRQRWPEAIRCAERLVERDRLREESHRLLVRLCRESGDRARALRYYHECAAVLRRELGIDPSPRTQAERAALIEVAPTTGNEPAPALGGRVPAAETVPFTGRRAELAGLISAWRESAGGRSQLVLVSGEAGVGKTRLVDELRACAAAPVVAEARAYPGVGPLAYGVVTAWLRAPPIAARLHRLGRFHLTELARLLPELAERADPPGPLSEGELRRCLFGAVCRALTAVGAPVLLIIDDAQWSDAQSLGVVHHLLRTAPAARLLVAATARREELTDGHPLLGLITDLQTLGRFSEIGLERLGQEETALLAEHVAGRRLEPDELDRLYGSSEGSPLFVIEALKPDAPASARRVQAVITGRLARLSPPAARLAGAAAAIGRAFTADVLAAATDLSEPEFVSALDELWRRGIIRARGVNSYDFSHGRIRDAAYAALGPPRRRQAHLAVAYALEQRDEQAAAAALASHYEKAGATEAAVRWYTRAAEDAQWLHAHADAVHALERALDLTGRLTAGPETSALQLRLLTALPAPLVACEGYGSERMDRIHRRALRIAGRLGREPEPPLVWSLAMAALVRGDWARADHLAQRLRTRAERETDPVLWTESAYLRGIAAYWPGEPARAREHFEVVLRRFQPSRRRAHVLRFGQDPEAVVGTRLAHALWLLGDTAEADRRLDGALRAAERSGHPYSRAVAWLWAGVLAMDRGDPAGLRDHLERLARRPLEDAPRQVLLVAEVLTGHVEVLEGRAAAGVARVRDARRRLLRGVPPAPGVPGLVTRVLLEDYALTGDPRSGLALAGEALRMARGAQLWEAEIRRLRALFLHALGAPGEETGAELDRALAVARRQGARVFEARVRETLKERFSRHDQGV